MPVDYHESVPLAGHVVLLCTALKDLVHFIAPLRQPLLTSRPILLVCPIHQSGDLGARATFTTPETGATSSVGSPPLRRLSR